MHKILDVEVTEVSIYQYGIFKGDINDIIHNPTSVTSTEAIVTIKNFLEKTMYIPAVIGKHFGIIYVIKGKPDGAEVNIKIRISHPPVKNPETNEIFTFTESMCMVKIGSHEFYGWIFEHKWELEPGKYSIQIFYDGKKMGEKTFTVYIP